MSGPGGRPLLHRSGSRPQTSCWGRRFPAETALSRPHQDEGGILGFGDRVGGGVGGDPPPPPRRSGGHRHRHRRRRFHRRQPRHAAPRPLRRRALAPGHRQAPALADCSSAEKASRSAPSTSSAPCCTKRRTESRSPERSKEHQPRWGVSQRPLQAVGGGAQSADRPSPRDRLVDDHRPGPDHPPSPTRSSSCARRSSTLAAPSTRCAPRAPAAPRVTARKAGRRGRRLARARRLPTPAAARRRGGRAWRREPIVAGIPTPVEGLHVR